jgi:hypothetical protein
MSSSSFFPFLKKKKGSKNKLKKGGGWKGRRNPKTKQTNKQD